MRLFAALSPVVLIAILAGCGQAVRPPAAPAATQDVMTAAELLSWRQAHAWVSREQMLHCFATSILPSGRPVIITQPLINDLAAQRKGLFPLAACEKIEWRDGLLRLRFVADQTVSLPNTFGQGQMWLSRELAFAVSPAIAPAIDPAIDPATADAAKVQGWSHAARPGPALPPHRLTLTLREGTIRISFTWVARLFTPAWMRETRVKALRYHLDEQAQDSALVGIDVRAYPLAQLRVAPTPDRLAIDVNDPDFPNAPDVAITPAGFDLPAIGGAWKDEQSTALAARALADPVAATSAGIGYRAELAYNLETRKLGLIRLWLGLPGLGMDVPAR